MPQPEMVMVPSVNGRPAEFLTRKAKAKRDEQEARRKEKDNEPEARPASNKASETFPNSNISDRENDQGSSGEAMFSRTSPTTYDSRSDRLKNDDIDDKLSKKIGGKVAKKKPRKPYDIGKLRQNFADTVYGDDRRSAIQYRAQKWSSHSHRYRDSSNGEESRKHTLQISEKDNFKPEQSRPSLKRKRTDVGVDRANKKIKLESSQDTKASPTGLVSKYKSDPGPGMSKAAKKRKLSASFVEAEKEDVTRKNAKPTSLCRHNNSSYVSGIANIVETNACDLFSPVCKTTEDSSITKKSGISRASDDKRVSNSLQLTLTALSQLANFQRIENSKSDASADKWPAISKLSRDELATLFPFAAYGITSVANEAVLPHDHPPTMASPTHTLVARDTMGKVVDLASQGFDGPFAAEAERIKQSFLVRKVEHLSGTGPGSLEKHTAFIFDGEEEDIAAIKEAKAKVEEREGWPLGFLQSLGTKWLDCVDRLFFKLNDKDVATIQLATGIEAAAADDVGGAAK